ncbi:MAG: hypothetical protein KDJ74_09215 [Notoacmeibacter sp.]|nr:hypothetical protein [Notoacmeibacter sp.]
MTDSNKKTAAQSQGDANERISRKLRTLYDSVKDEGIPDHFLDLLERLDAADKAASARSGSGNGNEGAGA